MTRSNKHRKDEVASPDSLIFFAWEELVFLFTRASVFSLVGNQGVMLELLRLASYAKETIVKKVDSETVTRTKTEALIYLVTAACHADKIICPKCKSFFSC